jgi:hypothetical protein
MPTDLAELHDELDLLGTKARFHLRPRGRTKSVAIRINSNQQSLIRRVAEKTALGNAGLT